MLRAAARSRWWQNLLSAFGRVCVSLLGFQILSAQDSFDPNSSRKPAASVTAEAALKEADHAVRSMKVEPGLTVDLWAAEPMLQNPVAFNFDEHGRVYVCETFRLHKGVDDIRGIMSWLDEELAARTVEDRLAEMKRHLGDRMGDYEKYSDRIRLLEDSAGKGRADTSKVFAEGFNAPLDG